MLVYGEGFFNKLVCEMGKPPAGDAVDAAKKSVDFFIYVPQDETIPKCVVYYDYW